MCTNPTSEEHLWEDLSRWNSPGRNLRFFCWSETKTETCRRPIMCHKGTTTEEPREPPFCKHPLFYWRFACRSEFQGCEGELLLGGLWLWIDRGTTLAGKCFLRGATDVGGTESGSTDGARGKKNKAPVEERRLREDISIRHELFNLPLSLFCRVSVPSSGTFFHPQKSTATVAQVPK